MLALTYIYGKFNLMHNINTKHGYRKSKLHRTSQSLLDAIYDIIWPWYSDCMAPTMTSTVSTMLPGSVDRKKRWILNLLAMHASNAHTRVPKYSRYIVLASDEI
jgi:hypothetical protein